MAIKRVEIVPPLDADEKDLDTEIEAIKAFFNDPKSRSESDKLRHCIKYVLAEIASEEEEIQAQEKAEIEKNKGPSMMDFLFGKPKSGNKNE